MVVNVRHRTMAMRPAFHKLLQASGNDIILSYVLYHPASTNQSQNHRKRKCAKNYSTLRLKKVPIFKLSVTLSNLNRFPKFLHCWKACEICYKTTEHYQPHLRHVVTLPWDIKNSNFVQIFSRYGTSA